MEKERKRINYQNGKIYKIVCNETGLVYYGSTCKPRLCDRLSKHTYSYKAFLKGKQHYYASFDVLENGNYNIILVENYACNNKDELTKKEREYIENNICVNRNIPNQSRKEYYQNNKTKLLNQNKEYYQNNKTKVSNIHKEYYESNKTKILDYKKQYRLDNKDLIKKKKDVLIKCECGCEIKKYNLKLHKQTKKHLKNMELKLHLDNI